MILRTKWSTGITYINGKEVIVSAGKIELPDKEAMKLMAHGEYYPNIKKNKPIPECKHLLMIRGDGLGDILMLHPVRKELKRLYKMKIDFLTKEQFISMCEGDPTIDRLVTYKNFSVKEIDGCINMNMCEFVFDFPTTHKIDLLARYIGLGPITDKRLFYKIKDNEIEWARDKLKFNETPHVGLILRSSCQPKHMGIDKYLEVSKRLLSEGIVPVVLDEDRGRYKPFKILKGVKSGCGYSVRQGAAIMALCDVIFTPDTGFMHLANAMGKKVLAYFGSIGHKIVVCPGKITCILPEMECYPCNSFKCLNGTLGCLKYDLKKITQLIMKEIKK